MFLDSKARKFLQLCDKHRDISLGIFVAVDSPILRFGTARERAVFLKVPLNRRNSHVDK